jgi:putative transposase
MARPKRILYENAVYHVASRGNERREIFEDDRDRWIFLEILQEAIGEHRVLCHSWVLMGNHYHLLIETPEKNLPKFMAHLNGVYTLRFNKRHQRAGHLFQGRYKSMHVDKGIYLMELCRYVVLNPIRAGIKKHPAQYRWSSYRATAGLEKGPRLETRWILGQFAKRRNQAEKAYRNYVLRRMDDPQSPWDKAKHGLYLGGEEFLAKMQSFARENPSLDIPKFQKMLVKPPMEEVLERIAKSRGFKAADLKSGRRKVLEARDIAIYILNQEYGYTLKEIGKSLGLGLSAVGNRWQMMKKRLVRERDLRVEIGKWRMEA